MDEDSALGLDQGAMAGQSEKRCGGIGAPARRPADGRSYPAVLLLEALAVERELDSSEGLLDEEMVKEEIVQGENAGMRSGEDRAPSG